MARIIDGKLIAAQLRKDCLSRSEKLLADGIQSLMLLLLAMILLLTNMLIVALRIVLQLVWQVPSIRLAKIPSSPN